MKTLRWVRNVSAVFIFVVALLAPRPGLGGSRGASGSCVAKNGHNCTDLGNGTCVDSPCRKSAFGCQNLGCGK